MTIYLFLGALFIAFGVGEILFQAGKHSWGIRSDAATQRLRSRFGAKWTGPAAIVLGLCLIANYALGF